MLARALFSGILASVLALTGCSGSAPTSGPQVERFGVVGTVDVLRVGSIAHLRGEPLDADGQVVESCAITWRSSDAEIVSVEGTMPQTGVLRALGAGRVRITATACNGMTAVRDVVADFPYPDLAGTYQFQAVFDNIPGERALGTIEIFQPSRMSPALTSRPNIRFLGYLLQPIPYMPDELRADSMIVLRYYTTNGFYVRLTGHVSHLAMVGEHRQLREGGGSSEVTEHTKGTWSAFRP